MTRLSQIEEEQFYLEHFLGRADFKADFIEKREPPEPDFIIQLQGRNIGVELTNFHSHAKASDGSPRRLVDEEWDKLQENLMVEVRKYTQLDNIYAELNFKQLYLPSRREQKFFIDEVISFSVNNLPTENYKELVFSAFGKAFPFMEKYLRVLELKKVNCFIHWNWNHTGSAVGLCEEELLDVIVKKNNKNYLCDDVAEMWLLMYCGHGISQAVGRVTNDQLKNYNECEKLLLNSAFDKAFFYIYMWDTIFEWPGWKSIVKNSNHDKVCS